jgi:hypothetical protein
MGKKLQPGDYVVQDYRDFQGSRTIRIVKLDGKNAVPEAAHIEKGESLRGGWDGLLRGDVKRVPYTKKQPDRVWFHGSLSNGVLPMNSIRVPDEEAQGVLRDFDRQVEELQSQMNVLYRQRHEYAVEHRLEWEMPEFQDFDGLKLKKEASP